MKTHSTSALRIAAVAAAIAGLSYVLVGVLHPPNVSSSVITTRWEVVHYLACLMAVSGFAGITGVYARQLSRGAGWLTGVGYALLSLWFALILGFSFVEAFVLPHVAGTSPGFVDGWMSMFDGTHSNTDLGALPLLWTITAPMYMLGGLIFGVAVFRSGVPSRGAGLLLGFGTLAAPLASVLPAAAQPKIAIPVGLALMWLGWGLLADVTTAAREIDAHPGLPSTRASAPAH
ncbi:MAG TPA: hypothetical protein VGK78_01075 [Nocardioides sp.]|uniref:hypothetical protein n=1 Tax=Nocardioides sp. TaxID=35761 RepID=UPI002F41B90A